MRERIINRSIEDKCIISTIYITGSVTRTRRLAHLLAPHQGALPTTVFQRAGITAVVVTRTTFGSQIIYCRLIDPIAGADD